MNNWKLEKQGDYQIIDEDTDNRDVVAIIPITEDEDYDKEVTLVNAKLLVTAPKLLGSLGRCEFILRLISEGDHKALENALDAADEAAQIIAEISSATDSDETYQMYKGIKELAESENSPEKEAKIALKAIEIGEKAAKGRPDRVLYEKTIEAYDQLLNKNVL